MKRNLFKPAKGSGVKVIKMNSIKDKYDSLWVKYSKYFLGVNKHCYACGQQAKHVDHIKPVRFFPESFKDTHNHVALCVSCHSVVTARFDKARGTLSDKLKWFEEKRKQTNTDIPVKILPTYPEK